MDVGPTVEERLLELVRRELGAEDAVVMACSADPSENDPARVAAPLDEERWVVAQLSRPPEDREVLMRRMSILVSAFSHLLLRDTKKSHGRVPPAQSLKGELSALARRARALDAIVIDAHSPVVWGSARGFRQAPWETSEMLDDALRLLEVSRRELLALASEERGAAGNVSEHPPALSEPPPADAPELDEAARTALTVRALDRVRALPEFAQLRRGRPLVHRYRSDDLGCVAHSFAGIYALLLVFDGPFDELRAERAVHDALPRIERLVLALPPRDPSPSPTGNVVRLPRRR